MSRSKEERVDELADSRSDLKIQPEMPILSSRSIELKRDFSGTTKYQRGIHLLTLIHLLLKWTEQIGKGKLTVFLLD